MMAVGVSSNLPKQTSPIEQILSIEVLSSYFAIIFPFFAIYTPIASRLRFLLSAYLPTANRTVSNYSFLSLPSHLKVTIFLFQEVSIIETGTALLINLIPKFSIYFPTFSAICWSNPRNSIDLTMMVTSYPNPWMNPPHYKAIYEAPTINVLPGPPFFQNISSDVMQCSLPGMSGIAGLPPVAMRILRAEIVYALPSWAISQTQCFDFNLASLLQQITFQLWSLVLYLKLRDLIQSVILVWSSLQLWEGFGLVFHPAAWMSVADSPSKEAQWQSFLGMQPTFTHVPPKPHLVPCGEGLTKSANPTLALQLAAAEAAAIPPDPPPITNKSYWQSISSLVLIYCFPQTDAPIDLQIIFQKFPDENKQIFHKFNDIIEFGPFNHHCLLESENHHLLPFHSEEVFLEE